MSNLLEELYYIAENQAPIKPKPHHKQIQKLAELEEILTQLLQGTEKTLFLDFVNTYDQLNGTTNMEHFNSGFRMGVKLMSEIFMPQNGRS